MTREEQMERRRRIAEFCRRGGTSREAMAEFGVSAYTVYLSRKGCMGRPPKPERGTPPGTPLARSTYKVIAALCNTDDTIVAIAAAKSLSVSRVSNIYRRSLAAGVPVRERHVGRPRLDGGGDRAQEPPRVEDPTCSDG